MNDLQDALTGALNAVAHEDEVHIERLLSNARAVGRQYRRRRHVLLAGGGALAALVPVLLVVAGLAFYGGGPGQPVEVGAGPDAPAVATAAPTAAPSPVSTAALAAPPQLPVLKGGLPAEKSASAVGRGAFHVGVGELPFSVATMQWTSDSGLERVLVTPTPAPEPTDSTDPSVAAGGSRVSITLARSTGALTTLGGQKQVVNVGAHKGQLITQTDTVPPLTIVRWQPGGGLWAEVSGQIDEKAALTIATGVSFDRTYACVVPFQLRPRPPTKAGTVSSCTVSYAAGSWSGQFTYDYGSWTLDLGRADEAGMDFKETIGGRPAWTDKADGGGGPPTLRIQVSYGGTRVADLKATGRYEPTTVTNFAIGYEMIDSASPADWWQVPTA
jgi:hypothetical protein